MTLPAGGAAGRTAVPARGWDDAHDAYTCVDGINLTISQRVECPGRGDGQKDAPRSWLAYRTDRTSRCIVVRISGTAFSRSVSELC